MCRLVITLQCSGDPSTQKGWSKNSQVNLRLVKPAPWNHKQIHSLIWIARFEPSSKLRLRNSYQFQNLATGDARICRGRSVSILLRHFLPQKSFPFAKLSCVIRFGRRWYRIVSSFEILFGQPPAFHVRSQRTGSGARRDQQQHHKERSTQQESRRPSHPRHLKSSPTIVRRRRKTLQLRVPRSQCTSSWLD